MTGALDGLVTPKPPPNYRRPSACRGPSPSSPMRSGADRVAQWCAEPYKQRAPLRVRAGLRVQEITKRMRACQVLAAVLWQSQNENPAEGLSCGELPRAGSRVHATDSRLARWRSFMMRGRPQRSVYRIQGLIDLVLASATRRSRRRMQARSPL